MIQASNSGLISKFLQPKWTLNKPQLGQYLLLFELVAPNENFKEDVQEFVVIQVFIQLKNFLLFVLIIINFFIIDSVYLNRSKVIVVRNVIRIRVGIMSTLKLAIIVKELPIVTGFYILLIV